ncbi:MAG: ribose transport system substrate-binding protein [Mycobacterium sp.]|jgi:ribose transport system substrate-binding protein|nr:ribose transport system substrate-binding protein [Mycobacterium sp.]MDT5067207.1 ribose transport system substrate-binding protein [Mycobacterium sp.]
MTVENLPGIAGESEGVSRRSFLTRASLMTGLGLVGGPALLAACSATGSSSSSGGSKKPNAALAKSVGYDFPENSLPVYANLVKFAKKRASQTGYKLVLSADDGKTDKEIANVQAWIDEGLGAMVVFPLEPTSMEKMAKAAIDKGLIWVSYGGSMQNQSGAILLNPYESGQALGKNAAAWAQQNLGGQGKAAFLVNETIDLTRQRDKGVADAFTKLAPGVTVVAKQFANSQQSGLQAMDSILTAHPDINMVLTVNDDGAVGAYQSLLNRGRNPKDPKTYVGGQDGTQQAMQLIQKGGIFRATSAVRLKDIGDAIIDLPTKIAKKQAGNGIMNLPITVMTADSAQLTDFLADYA